MTLEELVSHLEKQGPALAESWISQVEDSAGTALPSDFKAFLRLSNGGEVRGDGKHLGWLFPRFPDELCLRNQGYAHVVEERPQRKRGEFCKSKYIQVFFSLLQGGEGDRVSTLHDLLASSNHDPKNVPKDIVAFGWEGWGNLWALDLSKPGGEVVWYDREQLPVSDLPDFPSYDGSFRLDMTFGEFVEALEVLPLEKPNNDTSGFLTTRI